MEFKKALGLVFHKLLDKKTATNPITWIFNPELYKIELDRCRVINRQIIVVVNLS